MSDGLSDFLSNPGYWRLNADKQPVSVRGWQRWNDPFSVDELRKTNALLAHAAKDPPIVPKRVTEYGRMMWAEDLGLPSYNAPAYFWLGRDAEAA